MSLAPTMQFQIMGSRLISVVEEQAITLGPPRDRPHGAGSVLGALAKLLPDRTPAEGASAWWNSTFRCGRNKAQVQPFHGGPDRPDRVIRPNQAVEIGHPPLDGSRAGSRNRCQPALLRQALKQLVRRQPAPVILPPGTRESHQSPAANEIPATSVKDSQALSMRYAGWRRSCRQCLRTSTSELHHLISRGAPVWDADAPRPYLTNILSMTPFS